MLGEVIKKSLNKKLRLLSLLFILCIGSLIISEDIVTNSVYALRTPVGIGYTGELPDDESGHSLSIVGDVNNDGYDDFVVGAPQRAISGETYLFLGKSFGSLTGDFSLSEANASFIGEVSADLSGHSVSGVGDVNNDGYDDFLIGAYGNDEGGSDAGQSYLILGRPTNQWAMDISLTNANATFIGETAGDQAGYSVSGAGDVNNDGFDDFLIGANQNVEGGSFAGQTYLILGRPSYRWNMDVSLANANASFLGEVIDSYAGWTVSGVGDINNDGFDDFGIGAPFVGMFGQGKVYIIFGKTSSEWSMDVSLSQANASYVGFEISGGLGYSIARAGDMNNDGIDDAIFGASNHGGSSGTIYIIWGKSSNQWRLDLSITTVANVTFSGPHNTGSSISTAGDVNNDDFDDIIIGAEGSDVGGVDAGGSYIILGRPTQDWDPQNSLLNPSDFVYEFVGETAGDLAGQSVSGGGDINNDGYGDVIIGASMNDIKRGKTYLLLEAEFPRTVTDIITDTTTVTDISTTTVTPTSSTSPDDPPTTETTIITETITEGTVTSTIETLFTSTIFQTDQKSEVSLSWIGFLLALATIPILVRKKK